MTLATIGLLATSAGVSLWLKELSASSLVWLTGPRPGGIRNGGETRLAALLIGPGVLVQLCGGLVASRGQHDTTSVLFVALAWVIVAAAAGRDPVRTNAQPTELRGFSMKVAIGVGGAGLRAATRLGTPG